MSPGLLITAIIVYILSLVASLALMVLRKKINDRCKKKVIIFHSALLITCVLTFIFFRSNAAVWFLIYFCSGVAIAGMILRSSFPLLLKLYYSVFLLSVLIFLYSPSLLFSLIAQQKLPEKKGNEFSLWENYYLIKQQSLLDVSNDSVKYKIVKRSGRFNKTMTRDISFSHLIDSVKVLKFETDSHAALRGYFITGNGFADSIDIITGLKMKTENEITIQRK